MSVRSAPREVPNLGGQLALVYVETPLHTRSREESSPEFSRQLRDGRLPIIPGNSLRGGIRARVRARLVRGANADLERLAELLEDESRLKFSDLRLLFFPVRTVRGGFVWATAREELVQLLVEAAPLDPPPVPAMSDEQLLVSSPEVLVGDRVYLDEISFPAVVSAPLQQLAAWIGSRFLPGGDEFSFIRERFRDRVVVLSQDLFVSAVNVALPSVAQLSHAGEKVSASPYSYREFLPAETIAYARISGGEEHLLRRLLRKQKLKQVQVGAEEGRGKGICALEIF